MDLCPSCGESLADRPLNQMLPEDRAGGLGGREVHRCPGCRRLAWRHEGAEGAWVDGGSDPSLDYLFDHADWKPELPEPWVFTPVDRRTALEVELRAEAPSGHPLFDQPITAIAHCQGCDDVVFTVKVENGWFALVHLTWQGRREPLPWPRVQRITTPLAQALQAHTH
ncbi:hypothetical protein ABH940_006709 [Streptacidiphilus sp. BW17]|jgi:hypothetical protein|uniref:hypothetical protein n=1 Tax=Streptacidiphilus sp. BW17 TaxID=3156274 RepID=UPI003513B433